MRVRCPPILTTVVAAAALVLLAAGCGSHSPSASGSSGQSTQAQAQQNAVQFADCMRSHGASNFPDAPGTGPDPKGAIEQLLATPQGAAALNACRRLLPNGGQPNRSPAQTQARTAAMLAFANCIRRHGFPNFPDPTSTGQLTHEMVAQSGINLHQPAVLQAGDACTSVTHGIITNAIVARFVAGQ